MLAPPTSKYVLRGRHSKGFEVYCCILLMELGSMEKWEELHSSRFTGILRLERLGVVEAPVTRFILTSYAIEALGHALSLVKLNAIMKGE